MKKKIFLSFRIIVAIFLIAYLIVKIDWHLFWRKLFEINPYYFLLILIILGLSILLSTLKWKILLDVKKEKFGFLKLLKVYLVGMFFNNFLPTSIGGDAFKIYFATKNSKEREVGFTSVLLDRMLGFSAFLFLGIIFYLAEFSQIKSYNSYLIVPTSFLIFVVFVIILLDQRIAKIFKKMLFFLKLSKLAKYLQKIYLSFISYENHHNAIIISFLIGIVAQLLTVSFIYYVVIAFGFDTSFSRLGIISLAVMIISMIPFSINALGIKEGSYGLYFTQLGMSMTLALSIAVFMRIFILIPGILGGIIYFLGIDNKKKKEDIKQEPHCS